MTDSVAVVDINKPTDRSDVETTLQSWLDNNTVTSVDFVDYEKLKRNRAQVIIFYTA